MKPRNPTLYRTLKQFTEDAINLIQERVASGNDIPTRTVYELETGKEGRWSMSQVEKPEWGLLIHRYEPQLVQLDSYAPCMRVLQADTVIAPHLDKLVGIPRGGATIVRTSDILPRFITSLLHESLSPNQEQFDALYKRMEDFFYSRQLNVRLIAPLINVTGPRQRTLLTDDVYVVPNSANRLERWINDAYRWFWHVPWHGAPDLTHSLEHQFRAPKAIGATTPPSGEETRAQAGEPPFAVAVNRINQMVTALRLAKHDYVAVPFIEDQLVEWHPISPRGAQAPLYPPPWPAFRPRYLVQETDVPDIAALYRALSHEILSKHGFIKVAVHRIERSVEETEPAQRLVDLVIALEALLLHGPEKEELRGEKRFRFSINGAYLLSTEPQERKRIFKELREAYDRRSAVVHGGTLPAHISIGGQRLSPQEFIEIVEARARQIIREVLELACKPNAPKHLVSWNDLVLGVPRTKPN